MVKKFFQQFTVVEWVVMVALVVVVAFAAITTLGTAKGADGDDRARRAKVALALAAPGRPAAPTVAPAPRAASKLPYGDGHRAAVADQLPLVVYVGCDLPRPEGAVAAKADGPFAGVASGVVVGYPVADKLYIDATLTGERVNAADVQRAVDAARKKIDAKPAAKAMPAAPKPLDWQISAEMPAPCICGDSCKCAERGETCPSQCPVAWATDYAGARKLAEEKGRPLFVVVGTADCLYCRKLEAGPLRDAELNKMLRGFVCLKLDAGKEPEVAKGLMARAYPTVVVGTSDGTVKAFLEGYQDAPKLIDAAKKARRAD